MSQFERLRKAIDAKQGAVTVTIVRGPNLGSKLLLIPDQDLIDGSLGDDDLDELAVVAAHEALVAEKSETRTVASDHGELDLFFEVFPPPPVLLIFGAVHVAQALSRFAKMLGFEVIVTDVRAMLATPQRFPDADQIIQAWPDQALEKLTIKPNTYVAILSHDPKFDEPALLGTLESDARYIGAVGSRKTNRERRERLQAAGLPSEKLDRIHGPIGLDIGALTPEEMAISILGEIIAVRTGRSGGRLREASGAIRPT